MNSNAELIFVFIKCEEKAVKMSHNNEHDDERRTGGEGKYERRAEKLTLHEEAVKQ